MHKADRWKIRQNPQRVPFNQFTKFCRDAPPARTDSAQHVKTPLYRMMRLREGFTGWVVA